jgi:hypothetical protein
VITAETVPAEAWRVRTYWSPVTAREWVIFVPLGGV